mmetsp:Transcript_4902/g.8523  ORF Transcript_4902/g.8523 Transcript_4902/m.8523 type:complete len:455 (-) Transcript_4902:1366-2730(-)|eukprot:CAMPEP_0119105934 /NCGR_PEP_ID=MMETSP1180-20130426/3761_1 /TAXON_ID=3052 ORGANISM="Chlamydomonas cf sp, Strain CCMP681" /NCGR_SAMPLE_ID=MMETSP1180 /ASSEMBLY_ACC=CAM_ASM_000741 /LENGTH=454 /DNA_ID=CAMNT_0007091119 /DNA_START=70 /DNA_END=1434 /DNA_ORIENTATION=+
MSEPASGLMDTETEAERLASDAGVANLLILHASLVFFMQVGFISLEVGYTRAKNVKNSLLKTLVNVLLTVLCWWGVGYAFAHGKSEAHGFIGASRFFQDSVDITTPWFFSLTFALSTATIVSGCMAERTSLAIYPTITMMLTSWVHPLVAHWVWDPHGWLNNGTVSRCVFLDHAGGAVVHTVGGVTGLVGAWMVGPRIGRFPAPGQEEGDMDMPTIIKGHDVTMVSWGTLMLWFGWIGFNVGSVYTNNPRNGGLIVDRVALNMALSAATSGLAVLLISSRHTKAFDLCRCCNGMLIGLVASTGCCAYIPPWAAAITGLFAGFLYVLLSHALVLLRIDDPLDSSAIHLGGGLLGVIMNGAFARPSYVFFLNSDMATSADDSCGGFFLSRAGGVQLGMQLLGCAVITAWAAFYALIAFTCLARTGHLRVDQATELAGIDLIAHGGPAYPEYSLRTN